MKKQKYGFTILEVLIVITLLALVAAFTFPNYTASVLKTHQRDMEAQISSLHSANLIFASQNDGNFWNATIVATANPSAINTALNTNLISSDGTTFAYVGTDTTFTATAVWDGCAITVDQTPIDAGNPSAAGC